MDQVVSGIPLTFLVIALVEWTKRFGLEGKALNAVSMLIGLAVGLAYKYSQVPFSSFSDVFEAVIYGLALGLTASGLYDAVRSAVKG